VARRVIVEQCYGDDVHALLVTLVAHVVQQSQINDHRIYRHAMLLLQLKRQRILLQPSLHQHQHHQQNQYQQNEHVLNHWFAV
jgi:hypothetical protein